MKLKMSKEKRTQKAVFEFVGVLAVMDYDTVDKAILRKIHHLISNVECEAIINKYSRLKTYSYNKLRSELRNLFETLDVPPYQLPCAFYSSDKARIDRIVEKLKKAGVYHKRVVTKNKETGEELPGVEMYQNDKKKLRITFR